MSLPYPEISSISTDLPKSPDLMPGESGRWLDMAPRGDQSPRWDQSPASPMWHQGGEDARSTDFTKDRPWASAKRWENTLGNNTLWKQHVGKYTFYYSPVRCPIWAHELLFYNSCIYVGYCDVVVLLCTLLCCSSSWCHVCPCLAFVLFSLYVSQLFCCISIVHTCTWLFMFFIISNWTHKPHFWVLMQSSGQFWRWTIEVSN